MSAHAKLGTGSPVGVVTPQVQAQHYIDTSSNEVWQAYGLTDTSWVNLTPSGGFVSKSGDTMTGLLVLSGDPTAALGAATKQYVDASHKLDIQKAGTLIGTRKAINLIEGSNVTLTVADNAGSDRVDVTVTSSGGGGADTILTSYVQYYRGLK